LIRETAASLDYPVDVEAPDDLPPLDVDPVRIREVLLNLLSNAIRHSPRAGRVSIQAEARPKEVVMRVIDHGSGIPADELPRIFKRFQKGHDSRGSGLGLAIARDLVRAHGGQIGVASVVGEGTTVTVTLPVS
ncbi:MAG: Sensor histidine kinase ResE, partial [Acidobacteria bacterium]|nr:Sensor histidine kinase ResE [Acidobacteriota bacterium]